MSAFGDWCEIVTRQVRFWPDHAEIARELGDHYEDHVRDLERIGYAPQLARQRALEAMGDPEEVGRGMDAVHQPLLGWLWMVSRWGVWLLLFIAFLVFGSDLYWFSQFTDPAPRDGQYEADGFFRFEVGGWENEQAVLVFTGTVTLWWSGAATPGAFPMRRYGNATIPVRTAIRDIPCIGPPWCWPGTTRTPSMLLTVPLKRAWS